MTALVAATAVFLITHFVTSTPLRPALVKAVGEWPYRGLYSAVALAALGWMIWAYGQAPSTPIWMGVRWLPALLMPFAFVLIVCGYSRKPAIGGAEKFLKSEDPARGIIRITRHPLMWGIMVWAGAHVLARGDVKAGIFLGGFFVLAGLGTILIDSRKKPNPDWARFSAVTS